MPNRGAFRPTGAPPTGKNPPPIATTAARLFFPQSQSLGIDLGSISPGLLAKVTYAGGNAPSFQRGSQDLLALAEVDVDAKQVERLSKQIGSERCNERDAAAAAYLARPLVQREDTPTGVKPPPVAVVEMDGGRLQIRSPKEASPEPAKVHETLLEQEAELCSPPAAALPSAALEPAATAAGPEDAACSAACEPRKSKHWREEKVGCLLGMKSEVSVVDPCPEIPSTFIDPLLSLKLAQEIGHCAVPSGTPFGRAAPESEGPRQQQGGEQTASRPDRPEVEQKRVLASRKDVYGFGPLLAAAAFAMGLYGSTRRAFVADGLAENWSVQKRYFPRWTAVLDFVHALTYVYAAAMAGRAFAQGWPVYERWIKWVWAGQVSKVIEELVVRQQELGVPAKEEKEGSPRRVVAETLGYLSNHKDKMRYDEYRKAGLPLMSSHVESTVKQINYRAKGTEKFWSEEGAEAILQLRGDYLSDDEPMDAFWQRRQAAATGQRRYRRSA